MDASELRENICVRCRRKCCCCVATRCFVRNDIYTQYAVLEEFNRSYNVYILKEIEVMTLSLCMILVIITCSRTSAQSIITIIMRETQPNRECSHTLLIKLILAKNLQLHRAEDLPGQDGPKTKKKL